MFCMVLFIFRSLFEIFSLKQILPPPSPVLRTFFYYAKRNGDLWPNTWGLITDNTPTPNMVAIPPNPTTATRLGNVTKFFSTPLIVAARGMKNIHPVAKAVA